VRKPSIFSRWVCAHSQVDLVATTDEFIARVDPNTPLEISIKALAELVKEGKIGGIGLSEVNADTIRKAHAVHPISAVEIELSLFTPDPLHNGIMEACSERTSPRERIGFEHPMLITPIQSRSL